MSPSTRGPGHTLLAKRLARAHEQAEQGKFTEALETIRDAKYIDPKNIYVLAFEKQVEQLAEFSASKILTEEQRADILESIPGIMERALEGPGAAAKYADTTSIGEKGTGTARDSEDKAAALEWLKNQYFQHAHEYVRKEEYQHALAEIRRVFIIEPTNRLAKDFETQIEELAALQAGHSFPRPAESTPPLPQPQPSIDLREAVPEKPDPATSPPPAQHVPESEPEAPSPAAAPPEEDLTPMLTEEWSSPVLVKEKPQQPPPEGDAKKRKVNNLLVAAILVGIVVLGLLIFFYVIRHRGGRQTAGVPATSAARPTDVYYGEPARAAEQSFVISTAQREGGSQGPEIILDTAAAETEPPPETVPAGAPARQPVVTSQSPIVTRTQRETPASNSRTDLPTSSREDSVSTESRQSDSPSPFVAVEKDPQIIRLEKPRFPDFAYARQLEGQVTLQVQIDADGRPIQTKIISSTNSLIEPAIVDAVMKSEFSPARMSTGPVTSWLTIPYRFKLQR